jgi:threonine dehydrogenase-like Zn-dependent dehydrogenase
MPHHCVDRTVLGILGRDGAFAEYLVLPEENLHLVPSGMPSKSAVFSEPLAAAFRIPEQIPIEPQQRVLVLGDGKLGQLIAQVMWLHTKQVVVVGRHAWKLAFLADLGIPTALPTDPVEAGADLVVEATGSIAGFERALELVRPEGTVVLKSTVAGETPMHFALPVINEVSIVGSRCGPFRPALEALAMGTIEVRPLVTEEYGIADAEHALQRAAAPDVMKVLIHME